MNKPGNIPVLMATGQSLAETWENSLLKLWNEGCEIPTEYDRSFDVPSKDCSMLMVVEDPASEPFIHRAFPGGLEDLEEYRQEVLDGIKDHWVRDPNDPKDERWEYTYHQRLTKYAVDVRTGTKDVNWSDDGDFDIEDFVRTQRIDQLAFMVEALAKSPISRRVQAITWQPWLDLGIKDPACLQSIWGRILPDDKGIWRFNMEVRFRSRDAYDAAFMNMFALICLQEKLAKQIAEKAGREVRLGRYVDFSSSYHVYGRRREHFQDNFLKLLTDRPKLEDRTWTREFAEEVFADARPKIAEKVRLATEEMRARRS